MSTTSLIAVGGYSAAGTGRGRGVALLALTVGGQEEGIRAEPRAVIAAEDPSFVLWSRDGSLLYAVLETAPTRLLAISVDADGHRAEIVADLALHGDGGCHLAFGLRPGTLIVADYGSGTVETVRLDAAGRPVEVLAVDDHRAGADDDAAPHPHQIVALDGTDLLAVPDLGLDRVLLYRQDARGELDLADQISFPPGSGPRHLAADDASARLCIACELSGMVAVVSRQETRTGVGPLPGRPPTRVWSHVAAVPASGAGAVRGAAGAEAAAAEPAAAEVALSHIELAADGDLLLVASRGPDTLSLLSLAEARPVRVAEIAVGAHPRHFTQLGDLILVAAQEADRIDVLRRRGEQLAAAGAPIPLPSPSCLAVRPA
ncbi:lactonase family protein [Brachybacterium sp. DNPG3]